MLAYHAVVVVIVIAMCYVQAVEKMLEANGGGFMKQVHSESLITLMCGNFRQLNRELSVAATVYGAATHTDSSTIALAACTH